jgi:hypothetical protein
MVVWVHGPCRALLVHSASSPESLQSLVTGVHCRTHCQVIVDIILQPPAIETKGRTQMKCKQPTVHQKRLDGVGHGLMAAAPMQPRRSDSSTAWCGRSSSDPLNGCE